jgi:hypothetical protein
MQVKYMIFVTKIQYYDINMIQLYILGFFKLGLLIHSLYREKLTLPCVLF